MSLLFSLLVGGQGSEIERIIAEELTATGAAQKGKKAVQLTVRRSLARTGSTVNQELRGAFSLANPYNLKELYRHPDSGIVVARQAKEYPPSRYGSGKMFMPGYKEYNKFYAAGSGFRRGMNYHLVFEDGGKQEVYIGAQSPPPGGDIYENPGFMPKKKPLIFSQQWQQRFKNWQEAGQMGSAKHGLFTGPGMRKYLSAIGAPTNSSSARRPARPVMQLVQQSMNPASIFRQALRERLSR